ncbi:MAG: hypothetical protein N4A57_07920 [Anaeromicrobium sp.]|jgi:hypothetical protein|nr:hypothetical protein [Anaeromicrobium sp.]MCT4594177.1 hypothetical protein [Anaeromicrobium sp.]
MTDKELSLKLDYLLKLREEQQQEQREILDLSKEIIMKIMEKSEVKKDE